MGAARELVGEVRCPSGRVSVGGPGAPGVVVDGLPRTLAIDLWGVRPVQPEHAHRWRWLYLDILPGARSIVSEPVGRVTLGAVVAFADEVRGAGGCLVETTWPAGEFEVLRDLDDQGRVSRVRVDLGSDEVLARLEALGDG